MFIVFKTKEEAPEHLRSQLKDNPAGDGTFVLEGDGSDGILNKNKELLTQVTELKKFADKFKGLGENVTADTIKKALDELQNSAQREEEIAKRVKAAVDEANRGFDAKSSAWQTERTQLTTALEEHMIDSALTTAITAADGDPFFILPKLRSNVKMFNENGKYVVKVLGEDGKPAFGAKGDPMTMEELVAKAKENKQYATVFKAPAASGPGEGERKGAPIVNKDGNGNVKGVTITREQYKDPVAYRAAVEQVKGNRDLITVTD